MLRSGCPGRLGWENRDKAPLPHTSGFKPVHTPDPDEIYCPPLSLFYLSSSKRNIFIGVEDGLNDDDDDDVVVDGFPFNGISCYVQNLL